MFIADDRLTEVVFWFRRAGRVIETRRLTAYARRVSMTRPGLRGRPIAKNLPQRTATLFEKLEPAKKPPEPLSGGIFIPREETENQQFLTRVRMLAKYLDSAFVVPGTKFRFGFDPVMSVVPIFGDALGTAIGGYIILTASRLGLPRTILARMMLNVGIDAVVGAVPFVGPLLDAGYRSNTKNARLLEAALTDADRTRKNSVWVVWGLVGIFVGILTLGVIISVYAMKTIWNALT